MPEAINQPAPLCPRCGGNQAYKNGGNTLKDGTKITRYYCPDCNKTFQEKKYKGMAQ